jgi:pilus assembly protein FimV
MNRPLPLTLAIALTLGSSAAQAMGLGGITVKSELNEPLRAEIPVFVAGPDEAKSLHANLAAAEEFSRVGLSIGAMSVPISFEIVRNARGEPVIEVTSEQPVREPFLSFILEVNWANGKLLREYSILLDPPVSAPAVLGSLAAVERLPEQTPIAAEPLEPVAESEPVSGVEPATEPMSEPISEPIAEQEPTSTAGVPEAEPGPEYLTPPPEEPVAETPVEPTPEPVDSEPVAVAPMEPEPTTETEPSSEPEVSESPMSTALAASEYGPVASGETLWEIATTTRPNEAITLNQMMLALLRANPQAFYQDNVNTLKRGAILRIPAPEEIEATRAAQAAAEVLNQNRTWIESTRPTMVADASSSSGFAAGTGPSGTSSSSRLELVPPASGGLSGSDRAGTASGTANAATAAELARTKEALNSSQSESRELRDRVKELEGLTSKSERLIQLKDTDLKALQDRLAAAEKRAIDAAAALAAAQGDAATARRLADESAAKAAEAQRIADERAAEAEAAKSRPEPVAADSSPATTITDTAATDAANSDAGVDPMTPAEPLDGTSLDSIDPTDTAAGDVTGTDTSTEPSGESAEVVPLADAEPVDTNPPEAVVTEPVAAAKPWYQNFYILGGGGLLLAALAALGLVSSKKRKAAEKVAEPRSSIAHNFSGGIAGSSAAASGHDSVETDLLNALALDPTDLNAHLNVLEYFYTRRDPDKFEAAAEAMHAQVTDPNAAEWQGAMLMGADICPTHPLFSGLDQGGPATNLNDPFASGDFDLHQPSFTKPTNTGNLGRKDVPTPKATPAVPASSFDFDRVSDQKGGSKKPSEELSFDFDLDLDTPAKPSAKLDIPSLEIPNLDFTNDAKSTDTTQQMNALSADFLGDDAVATKIDLARAYLDMGDSDGARSMLEEVLTEGNVSQRDEAKKLLSEIR